MIGRPFVGNVEPALAGRAFTETYAGTLGRSVRAVAPLVEDGDVVGLVAVGISTESVGRLLSDRLRGVAIGAVLVFGVALAGATLVSRRVRRQTRGLGGEEIGRLYEFYDAVLHSVREGLLLTDNERRIALVNDEARRLLDLPDDVVGRPAWTVPLAPALRELLQEGTEVSDTLLLTGRRVLLVSQLPALWSGRRLGNVVTMRDHTELQDLTGELGQVRALAESLRSQAHEAANRMHTVISLVELGRPDDAVAFATAEIESAQRLTDDVISAVDEPVLAALLLGKAAQASERGIELVLTRDSAVNPHDVDTGRDLVTVLGNLIDNAIDAMAEGNSGHAHRVTVTLRESDDELLLQVADTGPGLDPDHVRDAFRRGWSTRQARDAHGRGLGLALVAQVVRRRGGTVGVRNDGGAVFTVRLPVPATAPPEHAKHEVPR
jgi:sensor histidine kinase regulating citrate/malate metabolism